MAKAATPTRNIQAVISTTPMRFRISPVRIISSILISPDPNTIAFGGVATGNIKAHDADSVAGIISSSGFILIAVAAEPRIGRIICVVAVFEVSSVRKVSPPQTVATIPSDGNAARPTAWPPIYCDRPDCSKPAANANPPPKSTTIPQFNPAAVFQFINRLPFADRAGNRNNRVATPIATVPSSIKPGAGSSVDQPGSVTTPILKSRRNIQRHANSANRPSTIPCSKLIRPIRRYSSRNSVAPSPNADLGGENNQTRTTHTTRPKIKDSGRANSNHSAKVISGACGKMMA